MGYSWRSLLAPSVMGFSTQSGFSKRALVVKYASAPLRVRLARIRTWSARSPADSAVAQPGKATRPRLISRRSARRRCSSVNPPR